MREEEVIVMKQLVRMILLFGCFTSCTLAQTPTKILVYQAFAKKNTLSPNLIVAQRYSGRCYSRSLAVPKRTDAWQCQASNMTLDPCFQDDVYLACVISPWSDKVAILQLNTPLNKSE